MTKEAHLRGGTDVDLPVDIRAELEAHDWVSATWTVDKLIAASPFRYEQHPSFAVIFDHGGWRDYGADDPQWASGGFVRLLSFLRRETYADTVDYLAAKYGDQPGKATAVLNPIRLGITDKPVIRRIDAGILDGYRFRSPYLGSREISEAVQRLMDVGYDRQRKAVTIPWFNPDGSLGNIKYRKTGSKTFWYAKSGRPIRNMLYGIHIVHTRKIRRAALVEAEVDALTLMSAGIFGLATGGTAFSSEKAALLLRSSIEEIILFRDRDRAGRVWRNQVVAALRGRIKLRLANVPAPYKDVNEAAMVGVDLRRLADRAAAIKSYSFPTITVDGRRLIRV